MPVIDANDVKYDIVDASSIKYDEPAPDVIKRSLGNRLKQVPGNILPSAGNFVTNTLKGLNPYPNGLPKSVEGSTLTQTAQNLGKLASGGAEHLIDKAFTKKLPDTDEKKMASAFGKAMTDRYGGWENVKKTMAEDPVGFMADASAVLSGGAGILGKAGLSTAAKVARVGSEFTNPVSMATKAIASGANAISKTGIPESLYARAIKMPPGSLSQNDK